MADPVWPGAVPLDRLSAAIETLRTEENPARIEGIATAAVFLDRVGDCCEALWRSPAMDARAV
jgi:hypothetical protein